CAVGRNHRSSPGRSSSLPPMRAPTSPAPISSLLAAGQPRTDASRHRCRAVPISRQAERPIVPLLQVENLRTHFRTRAGVMKAVDGVDLEVAQGRTLGIVGESGSGKSVTALSIMRLIEHPGRIIEGSRILFDSLDLAALPEPEMQAVRGNKVS